MTQDSGQELHSLGSGKRARQIWRFASGAEIAYMSGALLTLTSTDGKGTTVRAQFSLNSVE